MPSQKTTEELRKSDYGTEWRNKAVECWPLKKSEGSLVEIRKLKELTTQKKKVIFLEESDSFFNGGFEKVKNEKSNRIIKTW